MFDLSALAGTLPEGTDAQSLLDAFILDTEVASLEVVSQTDSEAVVKLVAHHVMSIDTEALAPFIDVHAGDADGARRPPTRERESR